MIKGIFLLVILCFQSHFVNTNHKNTASSIISYECIITFLIQIRFAFFSNKMSKSTFTPGPLMCREGCGYYFSIFVAFLSSRHRLRAGTFILSSFIHPVFANPETTDECLEDDDTSLLWRQDVTLRAQNKVKYLFLIGEERVCLISTPACLTDTDWLFTVSAEPSGHTGP